LLDVDAKGRAFCYSCRKKYLNSRRPNCALENQV
jgi:hypothetical protein